MGKKEFVPVFEKIFCDLDNIFADRHDEDSLMEDFGSICTAGIQKTRESLRNSFILYEDMEQNLKNGDIDVLAVFYGTLLQYSRFDYVSMADESLWQVSDILNKIYECSRDIEICTWTDRMETRWSHMNNIVLSIWPYIRDLLNDVQEQQSQQQGSAPQQQGVSAGAVPQPAIQKILEALETGEKIAARDSMNSVPSNQKSSSVAKQAALMETKVNSPGNEQQKPKHKSFKCSEKVWKGEVLWQLAGNQQIRKNGNCIRIAALSIITIGFWKASGKAARWQFAPGRRKRTWHISTGNKPA